MQDKGKAIRLGMVQVVLIPFPNLGHMQGGRLQLVLDNRFRIVLYGICAGIRTGGIRIVLSCNRFDSRVFNMGLDAAVFPGISCLILHR